MAIGYFIYKNVLIVVDLFSQHKNAMKPGEVHILSSDLKKQLFEALSGRPWDSVIDRLDKHFKEEGTYG